jgi:hypothetical protein
MNKKILSCSLLACSLGLLATNTMPAEASNILSQGAYGVGGYSNNKWLLHHSTSTIGPQGWDQYAAYRGLTPERKRGCENSDWIATLMSSDGRVFIAKTPYTADQSHSLPWLNSAPSNWGEALTAMRNAGGHNFIVCSADLGGGHIPKKTTTIECDPNNPGGGHGVEYENREVANIPYAVYTKLNEVIPKDLRQKVQGENLVKWKETHHSQDSDIVYTNAGEFLQRTKSELVSIMRDTDRNRSLSRWQDYKQRLQAEIDKDENDATAKSPEIQLDDKNKEGLALGGAFTVTESRNKQKIKYNIARHYNKTWGCVNVNGSWKWATTQNSQPSAWLNAVENGWRIHREDTGVSVQDQSSTPRNLTKEAAKDWEVWRSWQFLNVRCNKDELEAIIRSLGGRGDNSVTSKEGSGTVYTPVVKNRVATFFGDPNSSDPALRKTAEERFYSDTSSCEIPPGDGGKLLCEANPGHDSSNDNHNNIQNRGTSLTNSFGAQTLERDNLSKVKESSNIFTFFRDNISNPFRVDVWHPTGSNNKDFDISDNLTAEFTQFIFSPDGTPTDTKFNFEDKNKNKILNGTELNKKVTIKGQENRFHARGSWSSDKGHPHKGNIRYGYNVKVINNYPSVFSGKGPNAGANRQYTSLLPTYCDVVFNSTEKHAPKVDNRFNAKLSDKEMNYDGKNPNKDLTLNFNRSGEE